MNPSHCDITSKLNSQFTSAPCSRSSLGWYLPEHHPIQTNSDLSILAQKTSCCFFIPVSSVTTIGKGLWETFFSRLPWF